LQTPLPAFAGQGVGVQILAAVYSQPLVGVRSLKEMSAVTGIAGTLTFRKEMEKLNHLSNPQVNDYRTGNSRVLKFASSRPLV